MKQQPPTTAMGFIPTITNSLIVSGEVPIRNAHTSMQRNEAPQAKKPFYYNYKDISFDTLKERHDNFSFDKALESKAKIHDSLHF